MIDKSIRQHYANGKKGNPFYKDGEFQTFQQPTKNWDMSDYKYEGPTQSGYTTLGYNESGNPLRDFRGNVRSASGVKQLYKTPRTIADQNRVLGRTSASDSFMKGAMTTGGEKARELLSGLTRKTQNITLPQKLKQTYFPQKEGSLDKTQLAKNLGGKFLTNLATKKALSGIMSTGALSFLGPLAPFAAMYLANKGVGKGKEYLTQGFQQKGLSSLSNKVWGPMSFLQPKQDRGFQDEDFGVGSSGNVSMAGVLYDKQHGAGAYKDKTIRNRISNIVKSESTSDIAIDKINKLAKDLDFEHEGAISTTTTPTPMSNMGEIAAAARETEAKAAAAKAAAAKAAAARAGQHHVGQDAGQGGLGGQGGPPGGEGGWKGAKGGRVSLTKGGRVDSPLTGRVRDIG